MCKSVSSSSVHGTDMSLHRRLDEQTVLVTAVIVVVNTFIVLMAWLPVNAIRASEYQKITSPFDVQVLTTYSASSLEELPKTTLDYDYITKYLNENGYPLSKAATGQLYRQNSFL